MKAVFIKSAAREDQFIRDGKKAVVFAGRSNVGKSSVINLLTGRKGLAKIGNTPGKTSHVNYFLIDDAYYFVDLPGYGYAKVSHSEKLRWAALLEAFFRVPDAVTLGVLVTDARHKPTALDSQMAQLFRQTGKPFITLANKADKVKTSQLSSALALIKETLAVDSVLPVSSVKGAGKKEVWHEIGIRMSGD
ncbi:MAG: ribosome biogenesis GTP-binding protein YihA/YsxC [Oscillospiraceae bacterium]|nr:ribosome biogenesis GTP-binding protein YihA/YsxC [Oscillospiraceae bacterium]